MRFKRNINSKIFVIAVIMAVVGIGVMCVGDAYQSLDCVLYGAVIAFVPCIVHSFVPKDFDYLVRVYEDCLIIEKDRNDHRRFKRATFKIIGKSRKYLILYDETERATIYYNEELLEFLQEIESQFP